MPLALVPSAHVSWLELPKALLLVQKAIRGEAPLPVVHVGQEIVPTPTIGLGVATIGDVAATLVTVPPLEAKFVSFGAAAFNVALIFCVAPLIVIVTVNVCAPVPSGGAMPP